MQACIFFSPRFAIYKLPVASRLKGNEMIYYGSDSSEDHWRKLDPITIDNTTKNPVYEMTAPIFQETRIQDVQYVVYNDKNENKTEGDGGHAKGVLMVNTKTRTAVWFQHSVPGFLTDADKGYKYPGNGYTNGQFLLCLSMKFADVDTIAYHLRVQGAHVHLTSGKKDFRGLANFSLLLKKETIKDSAERAVKTLSTEGGKKVRSIAKGPKKNVDIFSTEINKLANDSIICQSWLLGRVERLPPYTGKHHVNDVEDTYLDIGVPGEPLKIRYSKDHSKWCVAVKKPFFCFVTLNRVASQAKRGGGATCFTDETLAKLLRGPPELVVTKRPRKSEGQLKENREEKMAQRRLSRERGRKRAHG